jgi:hypothetical protein
VVKKRGGWVCAGCLALERERYGTGTRQQARYAQYNPNAKYAEWMFQTDRGRRTPVAEP